MCLSECPFGNETRLKCWPTSNLSCSANSIPQFEVDIYPTEPTETSLGLFCQAKDPTLLNTILDNANLLEMY
jgi:tRNA A37 threonylcarbamoyladenosine synthetase subunit TsaC/SUA5/YrdC